jgi:hypothetical protein
MFKVGDIVQTRDEVGIITRIVQTTRGETYYQLSYKSNYLLGELEIPSKKYRYKLGISKVIDSATGSGTVTVEYFHFDNWPGLFDPEGHCWYPVEIEEL